MNKRISVRLRQDLVDEAKRKAIGEGRTLDSLIEEGLRLVLQQNQKASKGRQLPRASVATGGPNPGVDANDLSALQEMDDLEYVERMKRF